MTILWNGEEKGPRNRTIFSSFVCLSLSEKFGRYGLWKKECQAYFWYITLSAVWLRCLLVHFTLVIWMWLKLFVSSNRCSCLLSTPLMVLTMWPTSSDVLKTFPYISNRWSYGLTQGLELTLKCQVDGTWRDHTFKLVFSKGYVAAAASGYKEDEDIILFFNTVMYSICMDTDPMGAVSMDARTPHVVATC